MKKKVFAGLLAVVMMALLAVPAMALTSYELFSGWEQDGYPGDVTGVFYNTEAKNLAILLTDNTEARQKQLRDTLTDGDTLTFLPENTATPNWRSVPPSSPGTWRKTGLPGRSPSAGARTADSGKAGWISGWW